MKIIFILIVIIIVLSLIFICLIAPNKKREISIAKAYAHRGLHGGMIPENSIAAFNEAVINGYGIEFDVQLTKDKKLVVFHDESLLRMVGRDILVSELTYAELCEFNLNNTEEKIPLLKEVLAVATGLPILCEIKKQGSNTNIEICSYLANELENYIGDICIESFSPFILSWFRKNRPEFTRGQLSRNFVKSNGELKGLPAFVMTNLFLNFLSKPDFIAYNFMETSFGFRLCKIVFRTPVLGWTAKGDDEREVCRNTFDGEIFELASSDVNS